MMAISNLKAKSKSIDSNFGLLIFLQIFTVLLCFGGPLSLFAPVPVVLALLIFGRTSTLFFSGLFAAILWYVSSKITNGNEFFLNGVHLVAIYGGVLLAEMMMRNVNPVKGLIIAGFIFVTTIGGVIALNEYLGAEKVQDKVARGVNQIITTIKENNKDVLDQGNEEARIIKAVISNPKDIVDEVMNYLPSIIFVTCFFALWICFYSVLRLSKVWRYKILYSFGTRDLITFKAPEYFVYPLIAALVLVIGKDYGFGPKAEVFGGNILYCLGVFYLFQGFGIFYDFLTFAKIGGIFKSAIMAFVLMASFKFLAIVGMFDLWFDFRKYFTRKNNDEGDML